MFGPGSSVPSLSGVDLLVILGSKSAVYDREVQDAWFNKELALIHEADQRGIPIFGICFGAQALCVAFGGTVAPSPSPEVGWYDVTPHNGSGIPQGPWFEFHFDRCELPVSATLWADNGNAPQAFAVGQHVGVQFHPEIDAAQLAEWMSGGADSDARDFGLDVETLMKKTVEEEHGARDRAGILVDLVLHHRP
jgi:GMP synthase-like glutamine amidotransferase